jgi:hypothetical protein
VSVTPSSWLLLQQQPPLGPALGSCQGQQCRCAPRHPDGRATSVEWCLGVACVCVCNLCLKGSITMLGCVHRLCANSGTPCGLLSVQGNGSLCPVHAGGLCSCGGSVEVSKMSQSFGIEMHSYLGCLAGAFVQEAPAFGACQGLRLCRRSTGCCTAWPNGSFRTRCRLQAAPSPQQNMLHTNSLHSMFVHPLYMLAYKAWMPAHTYACMPGHAPTPYSWEVLSSMGSAFCTTQPATPACVVSLTPASVCRWDEPRRPAVSVWPQGIVEGACVVMRRHRRGTGFS